MGMTIQKNMSHGGPSSLTDAVGIHRFQKSESPRKAG
jgi:hypothetical protein